VGIIRPAVWECEEVMDKSTLRSLIEEFASLQAAHRALAHAVHPSALAPVKEQSRELLIQLQALSADSGGDARDGSGAEPSEEALEQIRSGLKEQSGRTLAVLQGIELPQLRATIPLLSQQHPEEVRGLVDVLLSGDLEEDKSLRTLEYLITMLSTEEKGGRRVVIREPSHVTPRLRRVASQRMQGDDSQCAAAERFIEDATLEVLKECELGEVRDRVRSFKEDLGADVLQPRILAAAVTYNAAMWNRVAAEIDSSRSIEQLTEGLLAPDSATSLTPTAATSPATEVIGSEAFRRLVAALDARVAGRDSSDALASHAVAPLALESIRGEDADLFDGEEADEATGLMRAAVTVGLVLKHRPAVEDALSALGVDVELLAHQGVDELIEHMTELARKRFAASNYGEAFRLSDVKTHSLATHAAARRASEPQVGTTIEPNRPRKASGDRQPEASGWLAQLQRGLPSGPVLLIGLVLLAGFLIPPLTGREDATPAHGALEEISPFLVRGQHSQNASPPRFIGTLGPTWDYLGTPERREVASEIGEHFASLGTPRVTLADPRSQILAEVKDGKILVLVPRALGDAEAR